MSSLSAAFTKGAGDDFGGAASGMSRSEEDNEKAAGHMEDDGQAARRRAQQMSDEELAYYAAAAYALWQVLQDKPKEAAPEESRNRAIEAFLQGFVEAGRERGIEPGEKNFLPGSMAAKPAAETAPARPVPAGQAVDAGKGDGDVKARRRDTGPER